MNKLILIVDDNATNCKLVRDLVKAWGYDCIEAGDGEQAVNLALQKKPDVILMDLRLPVMDGLTASKILKSDKIAKNIPIIIITSSAMKGDSERVKAAGCDHYISKPFDIAELRGLIQQCLSNSREKSSDNKN